SRGVRHPREPTAHSDARPLALPQSDVRGREPRDVARRVGDVRGLLLQLAVCPGRHRLLGGADRRTVPSDDASDRLDRATGRTADRSDRLALADRRRHDARRVVARPVRAARRRRDLLELLAGSPPRGWRNGDVDDADHRGRDERRSDRQGGGGLRRVERLAPGRRLARSRAHGRDRRVAAARLGTIAALRGSVHDGLPPRAVRSCRDRARWCLGGDRARPESSSRGGRPRGGKARCVTLTRRMPAAERRQALIDTALSMFGEGSYRGTTTAEIAHEARVSEPILYRHFASKRDLYLACIDEAWRRLRALWEET